MSCSPEFMCQKPARSPEKPSFTQTCNLLSQYLKERGGFGDLNLGITRNVEANGTPEMLHPTMNLFPVDEKSGGDCGRDVAAHRQPRSMDLFPKQEDDGPKRVDSSVTTMNKSAVSEPQAAQMTIFYNGQVIVFDEFPTDKAKEIMLLAGQGSSQNNSLSPKPPTSNVVVPNFSNTVTTQECVRSAQRPIPCDLPIARRASLHRFLAKRQDRITTKAPYQISNPTSSPSKPSDSKSWLGLATRSPRQSDPDLEQSRVESDSFF